MSFPYDDVRQLRTLEEGFYARNNCTLAGCVGALDGIAIKICKVRLSDAICPMSYYCRKSCFSIDVQAMCDASCRFTWTSANSRGSTHDSTAWVSTLLAKELDKEGGMPAGFWIAGDEAYAASDYMITPYSGKQLDSRKDAFNFYQSSTRITIERAFGCLVARWGVLHRPLTCNLRHSTMVVEACMLLHNICITESNADINFASHTRRTTLYRDTECDIAGGWPFPQFTNDTAEPQQPGYRRDLERSTLRNALATNLHARSLLRPDRNHYRRI
jgi:hypothetical protein